MATKQVVTITMDKGLTYRARRMGINVSQVCNTALHNVVDALPVLENLTFDSLSKITEVKALDLIPRQEYINLLNGYDDVLKLERNMYRIYLNSGVSMSFSERLKHATDFLRVISEKTPMTESEFEKYKERLEVDIQVDMHR